MQAQGDAGAPVAVAVGWTVPYDLLRTDGARVLEIGSDMVKARDLS